MISWAMSLSTKLSSRKGNVNKRSARNTLFNIHSNTHYLIGWNQCISPHPRNWSHIKWCDTQGFHSIKEWVLKFVVVKCKTTVPRWKKQFMICSKNMIWGLLWHIQYSYRLNSLNPFTITCGFSSIQPIFSINCITQFELIICSKNMIWELF